MAENSSTYPSSVRLSIKKASTDHVDLADFISTDIDNLKIKPKKVKSSVNINISFDVNQTEIISEPFTLSPDDENLLDNQRITFLEIKKLDQEFYKIDAKQMPLLTITSTSGDDNSKTIDLSFIILSYFLGAGDKLKGSAGDKLKGSAGDKLKGSAGDKLKGSAGDKLKGSAGGKLQGSAGAKLPGSS